MVEARRRQGEPPRMSRCHVRGHGILVAVVRELGPAAHSAGRPIMKEARVVIRRAMNLSGRRATGRGRPGGVAKRAEGRRERIVLVAHVRTMVALRTPQIATASTLTTRVDSAEDAHIRQALLFSERPPPDEAPSGTSALVGVIPTSAAGRHQPAGSDWTPDEEADQDLAPTDQRPVEASRRIQKLCPGWCQRTPADTRATGSAEGMVCRGGSWFIRLSVLLAARRLERDKPGDLTGSSRSTMGGSFRVAAALSAGVLPGRACCPPAGRIYRTRRREPQDRQRFPSAPVDIIRHIVRVAVSGQ